MQARAWQSEGGHGSLAKGAQHTVVQPNTSSHDSKCAWGAHLIVCLGVDLVVGSIIHLVIHLLYMRSGFSESRTATQ